MTGPGSTRTARSGNDPHGPAGTARSGSTTSTADPGPVDGRPTRERGGTGRLSVVDRTLYALFSGHADWSRHDADRATYRGTNLGVSFERYLSRVYGCSWVAFVGVTLSSFLLGLAVSPDLTGPGADVVGRLLGTLPTAPSALGPVGRALPGVLTARPVVAGSVAVALGLAAKRSTVWFGGRYLSWVARRRRDAIEHTLPGAVRYLRALSTGADDRKAMVEKVAANRDAYGETAVAFGMALNRAALTGSLADGLQVVARDTPSRDVLAPFLLKFREHASQGGDALEGYLRMEARMLSHRQDRTRAQAEGFLELLAELFIVLLVLPALFVIVLTVMSVLSPSLSQPVSTPFGTISARAVLVYAAAGFVLAVGAGTARVVESMRPPSQSAPTYDRPGGLRTLRSATVNPASALVVFAPIGVAVALAAVWSGTEPVSAVLSGYVACAVPTGLVGIRRARRDDAKDREMKDFVHAVSSHVGLGRPFPEAVERVARDVDLGALDDDVADLAFNAGLTTVDDDRRTAALDRFVDRVGTPLAEQTVGLVTGALDAGSDSEDVFETLQTEVGRLHHEKKSLRNAMLVYVAIGWTTALLIVGIVVAVNVQVLDGFEQLAAVAGHDAGMALDPTAIDPERDRHRFYVVTQATMLSCGWFAGMASRGLYEALLHSGLLVVVAAVVFQGAGAL